jgi:hypothetical protein
MSMETLLRMQAYHRNAEDASWEAEKRDAELRKQPTPPAQLEREANELYAFVRQKMTEVQPDARHWKAPKTPLLEVNLDQRYADDVIAEVIKKFQARKWRCEHIFNWEHPHYDALVMIAPDDWIKRLLGESTASKYSGKQPRSKTAPRG